MHWDLSSLIVESAKRPRVFPKQIGLHMAVVRMCNIVPQTIAECS